MKNCFDCKFKESFFENLLTSKERKVFNEEKESYVLMEHHSDSVSGNRYGRCKKGNTSLMINFRKENGDMTRTELEEKNLILDCHEYSDGVKMLDDMIAKTNTLKAMLADIKRIEEAEQYFK